MIRFIKLLSWTKCNNNKLQTACKTRIATVTYDGPPIIERLKTEKVETNENGDYLVTYTAITPNPQIITAPKNLVVDDKGQINVIDFDRAVLDE